MTNARAHRAVRSASVALRVAVLALAAIVPAAAEEPLEKRVRFGGLVFGDAYHVASHHTEEGENATGAVLRRGYFTIDADLSDVWFGRLRFEVNQAGEFETYDFEADVKDLHAGRDFGRHRVLFGLAPTPTFDLLEKVWGMRYLVRTPLDLQGVASRDTGIRAQGPIGDSERWGYRTMLGAGLEFGNETGDGRKGMAAVTWNPTPAWTVDLYYDYEELPGRADRTTWQGMFAYEAERVRFSGLYSNQDRQDDPPLELASAFVVGRLSERSSAVLRIDRLFANSPAGDNISYIPFDPSSRATFYIGGVEIELGEHVRLTPNVLVTTYDVNDEGFDPATDKQIRLTLFVDFE